MVRVNQAATWLSARVWERQVFDRRKVHDLFYYELRRRFGLPAQHAVQVISRVVDSYKTEKRRPWEADAHRFRAWSGIAIDSHRAYTLSLCADEDLISILLLDGRHKFAIVMDARARALLATHERGEAKLIYRRGKWFVQVSVTVPESLLLTPTGWLGVDLGIVNLAVDSDGAFYGTQVRAARVRHRRLRRSLQKCGSRSAKRHLKKLSGQERRLAAHTNHVIAKRLVEKAQGTGRGIALEDLEGIRDRVTVSRALRREVGNWAFHDLRQKVTYKAQLRGVLVRLVNPRYTSQQCPVCGLVDRANRPSQAVFRCTGCGVEGHADVVAATNIAARVDVNPPIVSTRRASNRPRAATQTGTNGVPARVRHKVVVQVVMNHRGDDQNHAP